MLVGKGAQGTNPEWGGALVELQVLQAPQLSQHADLL
jgi:hypothetical protein